MATDVPSGLGFVRFWALAPALDICKVLQQHGAELPPNRSPQSEAAGSAGQDNGCAHQEVAVPRGNEESSYPDDGE